MPLDLALHPLIDSSLRNRRNIRRRWWRRRNGRDGDDRRLSHCGGEVAVGDESVSLPPKEFELLEAFLRRKGRLLTRDFLIEEVWGPDYFGDTRTLDVHVKRLRRKLEDDPHQPEHLLTVRGLGYKFVD